MIVINVSNTFAYAFDRHAITTNLNVDHFVMEGMSPNLRASLGGKSHDKSR